MKDAITVIIPIGCTNSPIVYDLFKDKELKQYKYTTYENDVASIYTKDMSGYVYGKRVDEFGYMQFNNKNNGKVCHIGYDGLFVIFKDDTPFIWLMDKSNGNIPYATIDNITLEFTDRSSIIWQSTSWMFSNKIPSNWRNPIEIR